MKRKNFQEKQSKRKGKILIMCGKCKGKGMNWNADKCINCKGRGKVKR